MKKEVGLHACPCCGLKTIREERCYEICKECYWEDDPTCRDDPDYVGGANQISLREAQENYKLFGTCDRNSKDSPRKRPWNHLSR